MKRKIVAVVVGGIVAAGIAANVVVADNPPGLRGYEGQPGHQGGHGGQPGGHAPGLLGYEGQPGNQGGH
jgi:hypothetical protein